jgi:Negative regulator of sigma F
MTCKDVNQALITAATQCLPLEAEDHLRRCEPCRRLVDAFSEPADDASPSPATLRFIEATIAADFHAVNPIAPGTRLFSVLLAVYVVAAIWGISDPSAFVKIMRSPQTGMILCALIGSAGLLGYSLIKQMVPGSRHGIPPKFLPFAIMASLIGVIATLFPFHHEDHFWINSWACLRTGGQIALAAAVPIWLVLRRGAVLLPVITAPTAGLFAGLAGSTALEINCPNTAAPHVLIGHLGVGALGAAFGLIVGVIAQERHV